MNRPTPKQLERMVAKFNQDFPVGTKVVLRKGVLSDDREVEEIETTVTAPATIMGFHSAVAWFDGISGCYDINGRVRTA